MHWLIQLAAESYPSSGDWAGINLPPGAGDQWMLVANLAGIDQATLAQRIARHYQLEIAQLGQVTPDAMAILPAKLSRRLGVLPLEINTDELIVAVSDPQDSEIEKQLRFATGRKVIRRLATPEDIDTYSTLLEARMRGEASTDAAPMLDLDNAEIDRTVGKDAPVVRLVRTLIQRAIGMRASDIHIHPYVGGGVVRFRIDGVLRRITTLPKGTLTTIIRFLKSNGGMDPSNSLVPQDGRASLSLEGRDYDLRISTLPTHGGEGVVLRVLDQSGAYSLERIRFSAATRQVLQRATNSANGLFLVTGPTGSGKSTTLYAMLAAINKVSTRIITVEEPVEYRMNGVTQIDVNSKAGLTFGTALRSILRQDPDVLLIGEIRDQETAGIAVNAALTGHLVFSTLHTMDALRTIPRLTELGVSPGVLADTLIGVMSQRLMRQLCSNCRLPASEPLRPLERLFRDLTNEAPAFRATGCSVCGYTGYFGRIPIAEVIEMQDPIRNVMQSGHATIDDITRALPDHWTSIYADAAQHIISGQTTPEEAQANLGTTFWHALEAKFHRKGNVQQTLSLNKRRDGDQDNTALIVSKNPALRSEVDTLLRAAGITPATSEDTGKAAKIIDDTPTLQYLVLDLVTDASDSRQLLREYRVAFASSGLPVVIIANRDDAALLKLLKEAGAPDPIFPPLRSEDLIARIDAITLR